MRVFICTAVWFPISSRILSGRCRVNMTGHFSLLAKHSRACTARRGVCSPLCTLAWIFIFIIMKDQTLQKYSVFLQSSVSLSGRREGETFSRTPCGFSFPECKDRTLQKYSVFLQSSVSLSDE